MICSKCGRENPEGQWTCSSCGEVLKAENRPVDPASIPYPRLSYHEAEPPPKKAGGVSWVVKLAVVVVVIAAAAAAAWYFFMRPPDQSTPQAAMQTMVNAVSEKDCETIFNLVPNSQIPANRSSAVDNCSKILGAINLEFTDFQVLDQSVNGDSATLNFQVTMKMAGQSVTQQQSANLVREDGKWKVEPGSFSPVSFT